MKNISFFPLLAAVVLGAVFLFSPMSVGLVSAMSFRSGDAVSVPGDEAIDGSIFISGDSVTIDGSVNGDVYCAGKTVTIRGDIRGDVLCVAQYLLITGIVDGDIRAAGQNVEVGADVLRNLTLAGQDVRITPDAIIDGEVIALGQTIRVDGAVDRSLMALGERVSIDGSIGQGIDVKTEQLVIGEAASIAGQSRYESNTAAIIATSAQIEQPLVQGTPRPEMNKTEKARARNFPIAEMIFGAIFTFVVGWLLFRFFPDFTERATDRLQAAPVRTSLIGLIVLFGGPIVFLLLAITIIGIPFAFLWLFAWMLILMCSTPLAAFIAGDFVSQRWWKAAKKSKLKQLAVGTIVLAILFVIPVIGWVAKLLVLLAGSGAATRSLLNRKR